MVEVNIKLYSITKCGYYKYGAEIPEMGSIEDIFQQLQDWSRDLPIVQTSTFEPDDSSLMKSYVLDIERSESGDFYMTMWTGVPATEANDVSAVSGNLPRNQLKFDFAEFRDDYIPGFATYFWISPATRRLATIRFKRSQNGHQSFLALIRGFLRSSSDYVIKQDDPESSGTVIVTGFGGDGTEVEELYPKFITESLSEGGAVDYIREHIDDVWKIKAKTLIVPNVPAKASLFIRLLRGLSMNRDMLADENLMLKYEFPWSPNLDEFESMYQNWSDNREGFEDIAFTIRKTDYWLGHEILKTDIGLEIGMDNHEVYSLRDIMREIEQNKELIIRRCHHEVG